MALKASPQEQARLLELQAIDTRVRQLDHRAKSIPEFATLADFESDTAGLRRELGDLNGALEDANRDLGRIVSDVEVVEARVKRDTERLQTSSSVKDVAGLESELAGLTRRQGELEDLELEVMERVEQLESSLRVVAERNAQLQATIAGVEAVRDATLGEIAVERSGLIADRVTIALGVSAELMSLYERQRDRYGLGASLLQYGTSSASGVKLNEFDMAAIRAAAPDDVVLCPDSSAILVRTADSGL